MNPYPFLPHLSAETGQEVIPDQKQKVDTYRNGSCSHVPSETFRYRPPTALNLDSGGAQSKGSNLLRETSARSAFCETRTRGGDGLRKAHFFQWAAYRKYPSLPTALRAGSGTMKG